MYGPAKKKKKKKELLLCCCSSQEARSFRDHSIKSKSFLFSQTKLSVLIFVGEKKKNEFDLNLLLLSQVVVVVVLVYAENIERSTSNKARTIIQQKAHIVVVNVKDSHCPEPFLVGAS